MTSAGSSESAIARPHGFLPALSEERARSWRLLLATDLDGTFLGGTAADRQALYHWIAARRDEVGLVFVSGRDPMFIQSLCSDGQVPWPDYVIGDVGTTIARVHPATASAWAVSPIEALEREIAGRWNDIGDTVRAVLADYAGLLEQDTPFRYRVSYHYDPARFDPAALAAIAALGLDALISHDCFLDVLPRGVSKGPSLLRLLEYLSVPRERVLVAGDTLNDLSMFETGLAGAAVGGHDSELLPHLDRLPRTRSCARRGAGGISEAIAAFALHPAPPEMAS